MNFAETLRLAFAAIWAHKLRSFLTILGMIVGVMTFMIVVSLLLGFSAYVDEKIAGIGSNSFTIRRFSFDDFKDTDSIAAAQRRNKELSFDELDFLREHSQLIDKIGAKSGGGPVEVKHGSQTLQDVSVTGVEPVIAQIEKTDIGQGRFFTDAENANAMRVAFVGQDVVDKLFPQGDAIGGEISIRGIPYKVIGVQTAKGTVFGQPQDSFIQLPIKTYGLAFGGLTRNRAPYFEAVAKPGLDYNDAVEEARTLMRIKRKLEFGEKDNFGILTPDAIAGLISRVTRPIGIVIFFVPLIAADRRRDRHHEYHACRCNGANKRDRYKKKSRCPAGGHSKTISLRVGDPICSWRSHRTDSRRNGRLHYYRSIFPDSYTDLDSGIGNWCIRRSRRFGWPLSRVESGAVSTRSKH